LISARKPASASFGSAKPSIVLLKLAGGFGAGAAAGAERRVKSAPHTPQKRSLLALGVPQLGQLVLAVMR
jgi:hypothetical protein